MKASILVRAAGWAIGLMLILGAPASAADGDHAQPSDAPLAMSAIDTLLAPPVSQTACGQAIAAAPTGIQQCSAADRLAAGLKRCCCQEVTGGICCGEAQACGGVVPGCFCK